MTGVATISQVGATAAYEHAWPWAEAFLAHLERMRDLAVTEVSRVSGVSVRVPEGTYVLFPDVRGLGRDSEGIVAELLERDRVAVVPGAARWFGPGAVGHLRICFSTSEGVLREGLARVVTGLTRIAGG